VSAVSADDKPAGPGPADLVPADPVRGDTVPSDTVPSDTMPADNVPSELVRADPAPADARPADLVRANPAPADSRRAKLVLAEQQRSDGDEANGKPADRTEPIPLAAAGDAVTYFHKVATAAAQRTGPATVPAAGRPGDDGDTEPVVIPVRTQGGPGGAKAPLPAPPGPPPPTLVPPLVLPRTAPAAPAAPPASTASAPVTPSIPAQASAPPAAATSAGGPKAERPGRPAPGGRGAGRGDLLGDFSAMRGKWPEIQRGFVDDPRATVVIAADLTGALAERLRRAIKEREQELRGQWDAGKHLDTEELRKILLLYRDFLHSLTGPSAT
jgi:hypothetical protein